MTDADTYTAHTHTAHKNNSHRRTPDASTPGVRTPGRDGYLDLLRSLAMIRIVFYHALGYAWFSLALPSMGVMFALAGSLMAASLDRSTDRGTDRSTDRGVRRVILSRVRRLLPALWLIGLFVVPAMFLHGWQVTGDPARWWPRLLFWVVPLYDPPGSAWGTQAVEVLWYVRAYLWFVLLSPAALMIFRRWPRTSVLTPLAVTAALSVGLLSQEGPGGTVLTDLATYGACWLLGFAHHDGMIRRMRATVLYGLAAVSMVLGAAWAFTHANDAGTYDLNEIPLGQALWSVGFVLVLLRFRPTMAWLKRVRPLDRLVTALNARALTVYLWHNIALVISVPLIDWLYSHPRLESLPLETTWFQIVVAWLLVVVAMLVFGWVEDLAARRRPRLLPWNGSLVPGPGRGGHDRFPGPAQLTTGTTGTTAAAVAPRAPL